MNMAAQEHWWHELRNAVGSTNAALMVVQSQLARGDGASAQEFAEIALTACAQAIALLQSLPTPEAPAGARDAPHAPPET